MCHCLTKRLFFQLEVLAFCTALFGQSAPAPPSKTFHVYGTITQLGNVSRGNWVIFEGTSTISVNADQGRYDADLPLGVWTATVTFRQAGTTLRRSRPRLFRVTTPTNVVLDLFVRPPVVCDIAGPPDTTPEQWDHIHAGCDGMKFFPIPSDDGVPFEVLVGGLDHNLCFMKRLDKAACDREFATYNLLSVQADKVVYHPRDWTLEASGNVVVKDADGEYRRDSAKFFIGDGRAIPIY
jgi:hypothetical protein